MGRGASLLLVADCGGLVESVEVDSSDAGHAVFDARDERLTDAPPEATSPPCIVGGTTAFQPETLPPPSGKHQNGCTLAQLDTIHKCELDGDMNACASLTWQYGQPYKTCTTCLESVVTDPTWGPLVYADSSTMYLNSEGCVNLATGQSGPLSCGQLLHSVYGCERAACADCSLPFTKCVELAQSGVCKKYEDAFALQCSNLSTYPEIDNCFRRPNETDSKALRIRMDTYFCGP